MIQPTLLFVGMRSKDVTLDWLKERLYVLCENEHYESESAGNIQFLLLFSTKGTERLSVML